MNQSVFLFLNNFAGQSDILDWIIIFCAQYLIFILTAGVLVFIYKDKQNIFWKFIIIFGGAIFAFIISQGINIFYPIIRPFLVLSDVNLLFTHGSIDSFPSGNATFALALAAGLFYYHKPLAWLYAAGALLIGVSRVIAGVHYPADIIAGYILGGAAIVIIYYLCNLYHKKNE